MSDFQSRWKKWAPKDNAGAYGSFVSSMPRCVSENSEMKQAELGLFNQQQSGITVNAYPKRPDKTDKRSLIDRLPTPLLPEYRQPWDSELIWDSLIHGKVIPIYSSILNEWIFWVWSEMEKERVAVSQPNAVIYTFDELSALTKAGVTHEGLKKLHEVKRTVGGKFTASTIQQSNERTALRASHQSEDYQGVLIKNAEK